MAQLRLRYVNEYVDRQGKLRRYFRRGAARGPLPGDVGSTEFMEAYQGYLGSKVRPSAPASVKTAESLGRLITDFYGSRAFLNLKPSSRRIYKAALEPLAALHGHRSAAGMTYKHAEKIIQDIGVKRPAMGNLTKKVMGKLMKYAVKAGWRDDNPVNGHGIDAFKIGTHHTWTDGELKAYEAKWRLGTRQRLAYALLLYTGQRVGDVAAMRRSDIADGMIHVIQEKTGAELYVPIMPELERTMKAGPNNGLALIGNEAGQPLSADGLSALIRRARHDADLPPKCRPHGLRKAAMRRLAENDATSKQIMAVSGHKTSREVDRYTEAANQKNLARDGMAKLAIKDGTGSD
jgi:site-specific recombinase XerD